MMKSFLSKLPLTVLLSSCATSVVSSHVDLELLPPRLDPDSYLQRVEQADSFKGTKPNVIFIYVDDLGYGDLSCYGNSAFSTPNLDKMAQEGGLFTQFYVAQPVCGASRAGLLTGTYPNRIGMTGAPDHKARHGINANEWLMSEMFKDSGYATGMAGKWHLGHFEEYLPLAHGFDTYLGIPYSNDMWPLNPKVPSSYPALPLYKDNTVVGYNTDQSQFTKQFTQFAIDFIDENKENPFFFYLAYPMPHVPLFVSSDFKGKSGAGLYGDVVTEIDWGVGEILKTLKAKGIDEDTLVVFSSDNGPWQVYGNHSGSTGGLREEKGTIYEGGIRVPMLVRMPAKVPSGLVYEKAAMTIDWLPTFASIIGGRLPIWGVDGKSMVDQLLDLSTEPVQDTYYFYYRENDLQATLMDKWKLVERHITRTIEAVGNDGKEGRYSYPIHGRALFNLEEDRNEEKNLLDFARKDMELKTILKRLENRADIARKDMGDSFKHRRGKNRRSPSTIKPNTDGGRAFIDDCDEEYFSYHIKNRSISEELADK